MILSRFMIIRRCRTFLHVNTCLFFEHTSQCSSWHYVTIIRQLFLMPRQLQINTQIVNTWDTAITSNCDFVMGSHYWILHHIAVWVFWSSLLCHCGETEVERAGPVCPPTHGALKNAPTPLLTAGPNLSWSCCICLCMISWVWRIDMVCPHNL